MCQVSERRVHIILNGVIEVKFGLDNELGREFRAKIGIPEDATIVMGIAGAFGQGQGNIYSAPRTSLLG